MIQRLSKRLRFVFWGSPDKSITFISLLVGLISLMVGLLQYRLSSLPPQYIVVRDASIVITLVFIAMSLSIKYFKKDQMVEEFRALVAKQFESNHHMIHAFRDHYFWDVRNEILNNLTMDSEQIDALKQNYFENVCRTILTDTRSIFMEFYDARGFNLEDDLSVTIKLVIRSEDAQKIIHAINAPSETLGNESYYIVTGYRDPNTWGKKPHRNEIMEFVYHINEENTTFDEIINKHKNFYYSNDLLKDHNKGSYKNQNKNWPNCYNSVLAVPIRYRRQGDHRANLIYGVISIDSLNPNKYDLFDDQNSFHLLASSADLLALMFGHFDVLQLLTMGARNQ